MTLHTNRVGVFFVVFAFFGGQEGGFTVKPELLMSHTFTAGEVR